MTTTQTALTDAAAATKIAALLGQAAPAAILTHVVDLLGVDAILALDVALTDATVAALRDAGRCITGSRARKAHLARFEALCEAHDLVLARSGEAALSRTA